MQVTQIIGLTDSCFGWILGLVFVAVGFVMVRPKQPKAGLLIGAAGALYFVRWCCGAVPSALNIAGEFSRTAFTLSSLGSIVVHVGFAALFLAGAFVLANDVKARKAAKGGA